jgi:hypothetical protein
VFSGGDRRRVGMARPFIWHLEDVAVRWAIKLMTCIAFSGLFKLTWNESIPKAITSVNEISMFEALMMLITALVLTEAIRNPFQRDY